MPIFVMPFGQYAGRPPSEIPESYLRWLYWRPRLEERIQQAIVAEFVERRRRRESLADDEALITEDLIRAGASPAGGWSREQLKLLGVGWPPRKGWKHAAIGRRIKGADAERFVALREGNLPEADERNFARQLF